MQSSTCLLSMACFYQFVKLKGIMPTKKLRLPSKLLSLPSTWQVFRGINHFLVAGYAQNGFSQADAGRKADRGGERQEIQRQIKGDR